MCDGMLVGPRNGSRIRFFEGNSLISWDSFPASEEQNFSGSGDGMQFFEGNSLVSGNPASTFGDRPQNDGELIPFASGFGANFPTLDNSLQNFFLKDLLMPFSLSVLGLLSFDDTLFSL